MGSLGILMLLDMFSDINAPGLKGKLKIFVLGLCLGHPVHSPKPTGQTQKPNNEHASTITPTTDSKKDTTLELLVASATLTTTPLGGKIQNRSTENVLKSVACGGMARVHACPKPGRYIYYVYGYVCFYKILFALVGVYVRLHTYTHAYIHTVLLDDLFCVQSEPGCE